MTGSAPPFCCPLAGRFVLAELPWSPKDSAHTPLSSISMSLGSLRLESGPDTFSFGRGGGTANPGTSGRSANPASGPTLAARLATSACLSTFRRSLSCCFSGLFYILRTIRISTLRQTGWTSTLTLSGRNAPWTVLAHFSPSVGRPTGQRTVLIVPSARPFGEHPALIEHVKTLLFISRLN